MVNQNKLIKLKKNCNYFAICKFLYKNNRANYRLETIKSVTH